MSWRNYYITIIKMKCFEFLPICDTLRWLDIVFQGQYLPSLSVNCVAINKDLEKLTPQLYQIKKKIGYNQGCNDIRVVIATK